MKSLASAIRILIAVLMIAPALWLVLFGPRSSAPVPPDRIIVRYWEKWTDFEGEAMKRLVDVFNETVGAEQGIFVQYATTTQIDLKSLVAIAGGDPPDLIGLFPNAFITYAAKGALLPLDEQAAASGINRELIIPVYFDQCHYHKRLYGVPLTPWSLAMYYNRDLFAEYAPQLIEAGLNPDRAPRTTDELLRYCKVLHKRNDKDQIELLGYLPSHSRAIGWYYHTWPIWFGGHMVDPQTGLFHPSAPEWIAGYRWVYDYCNTIGYEAMGRFEAGMGNFNSPDNPFMSRKLAMMRQGPWFANMIRQYAPDLNFSAAPVPTVDGVERSYVGQDMLVIPNGARYPEHAWTFVDWLYNAEPLTVPSGKAGRCAGYDYYVSIDPNGRRTEHAMPPLRPVEWICWNHYKNSPLIDPSPAFIETHPNPVIEMHERLARNPLAQVDPPLPNWLELEPALCAAYIDIWRSGKEPEARLKTLQERIDQLTESARQARARYGEPYP
jgi:multiple sugar transport system substrate-binding protein